MRNNNTINLVNCLIHGTGSSWINTETLKVSAVRYKTDISGIREDIEKHRLIYCDDHFTTPQIALAENIISNNIVRIISSRPKYVSESVIQKKINIYEKKEKIKLDTNQRLAVVAAVKNNCCIITGGPGTGKTSVIKCISFALRSLFPDQTISFAAPTGKAAKRITESTGVSAVTLNSELCIGVDEYEPKQIMSDTLICDEFSMVDIFLGAALMASIQSGHRLILSGDIDQLPSVGPGCVLKDFIESGVIPTILLTKTFRQDENSVYFENIKKIRTGENALIDGPDFHLVKLDRGNPMGQLLTAYVSMAKKYGVYASSCLIPFRQSGLLCSDNFNKITQEHCNKQKKEIIAGKSFKIGSPVIQYKNRTEVANGDVGKVVGLEPGRLFVSFDGNEVMYDEGSIDQIGLAYSISIHKSQGSEYPGVVMVLSHEHIKMCSRNILYTGATRGKKEITILYDEDALSAALSIDGNNSRKSMLASKIAYAWEKYSLIKKNF